MYGVRSTIISTITSLIYFPTMFMVAWSGPIFRNKHRKAPLSYLGRLVQGLPLDKVNRTSMVVMMIISTSYHQYNVSISGSVRIPTWAQALHHYLFCQHTAYESQIGEMAYIFIEAEKSRTFKRQPKSRVL